MRKYVLTVLVLFSCSIYKQTPSEIILGSWVYKTTESLGDGQNSKEALDDFNKSMEGKTLIFYIDKTYKATKKTNGQESVLQTGAYSIAVDGKSMMMGNTEPIKIALTDSIFKIYSPNNGAFVWRKLKD